MTAVPSRSWTLAAASRVAIVVSSQVEAELHGVMNLVAYDLHLVDHPLDQEQAPAARLLLAGQLRLQVGLLGVGNLLAAAVVGDPHPQQVVRAGHLDRDREVLPV